MKISREFSFIQPIDCQEYILPLYYCAYFTYHRCLTDNGVLLLMHFCYRYFYFLPSNIVGYINLSYFGTQVLENGSMNISSNRELVSNACNWSNSDKESLKCTGSNIFRCFNIYPFPNQWRSTFLVFESIKTNFF